MEICLHLPVAGGIPQSFYFHSPNKILITSPYKINKFQVSLVLSGIFLAFIAFPVHLSERIKPCYVSVCIFRLSELLNINIECILSWLVFHKVCSLVVPNAQCCRLCDPDVQMSFQNNFFCQASSQFSQLPCFFMPTAFAILVCSLQMLCTDCLFSAQVYCSARTCRWYLHYF